MISTTRIEIVISKTTADILKCSESRAEVLA